MLTRWVSFVAVAVLALVALAACGGEGGGGATRDVTKVPATGVPPLPTERPRPSPPASPGAATPEASPGAATPPGTPGAPSPPVSTPAEFTVEMIDIDFVPPEFAIPADTAVRVLLPNNGFAEHNFNIDALNVHSPTVPGGETTEVTITAPPGDYEYYCAVPGHKQAGMVGVLSVVEVDGGD